MIRDPDGIEAERLCPSSPRGHRIERDGSAVRQREPVVRRAQSETHGRKDTRPGAAPGLRARAKRWLPARRSAPASPRRRRRREPRPRRTRTDRDRTPARPRPLRSRRAPLRDASDEQRAIPAAQTHAERQSLRHLWRQAVHEHDGPVDDRGRDEGEALPPRPWGRRPQRAEERRPRIAELGGDQEPLEPLHGAVPAEHGVAGDLIGARRAASHHGTHPVPSTASSAAAAAITVRRDRRGGEVRGGTRLAAAAHRSRPGPPTRETGPGVRARRPAWRRPPAGGWPPCGTRRTRPDAGRSLLHRAGAARSARSASRSRTVEQFTGVLALVRLAHLDHRRAKPGLDRHERDAVGLGDLMTVMPRYARATGGAPLG